MTSFGTDVSAQAGDTSQSTTDSVKDKAATAADQGKQAAGEVAQTAGERAQDVKQEVTRQARDLLGEARGQLTQQVADQHKNLVGNLRSLSTELGSMADNSEESGLATELVGQARDRIDSAAQWLDGKEPGDILTEVKSFARRRPGTFLVGALAAGLVAGRLTRGVVASHQDDSSSGSPNGEATAPGSVTDGTAGAVGGQHFASTPPPGAPTAPLNPPADYGNGTYVSPAAGPQPEGSGYQPTTTYGTADPSPYSRPGQYPSGGDQGGLA